MTAEEVWQAMRSLKLAQEPSVHLALWPARVVERIDEDLDRRWGTFLSVRERVMKALEDQRTADVIGSPLEARVTVAVADTQLAGLLAQHRETLAEAFVVSDFCVVTPPPAASAGGGAAPQAQALRAAAGGGVKTDGAPPAPYDEGRAGAGGAEVQVTVARASGTKCQRCWKYLPTVGRDADHPQLCARCVAVVTRG